MLLRLFCSSFGSGHSLLFHVSRLALPWRRDGCEHHPSGEGRWEEALVPQISSLFLAGVHIVHLPPKAYTEARDVLGHLDALRHWRKQIHEGSGVCDKSRKGLGEFCLGKNRLGFSRGLYDFSPDNSRWALVLKASRVRVTSLEKWARTTAPNLRQRTYCNQISILKEFNIFSYYK